MMETMRFYVMRHGPAEGHSPSGRDFDRALSVAGRSRTALVARELERRGEIPRRILSSPLVRARQTAEIVASILGGSVEICEELAPSESAPDVVRGLAGPNDRVLVVGHAPDVAILVTDLLGRRDGSFEPAMVVALDIAEESVTECFVIRPSALGD